MMNCAQGEAAGESTTNIEPSASLTLASLFDLIQTAVGDVERKILVVFHGENLDELGATPEVYFQRSIVDGVEGNVLIIQPLIDAEELARKAAENDRLQAHLHARGTNALADLYAAKKEIAALKKLVPASKRGKMPAKRAKR